MNTEHRVNHALLIPGPIDDLVTMCGLSLSDAAGAHDYLVSDPGLVTCEECKVAGILPEQYPLDADDVLRGFGVDGGVVSFAGLLSLAQVRAIGTALARVFDDRGAVNYLEMPLVSEDGRKFVMTMTVEGGKTPHELKVEAFAERDLLQARLDALMAEDASR